MLSRALKTAVVEFLTANMVDSGIPTCEVRVVPPNGEPVGCKGVTTITVWDMPATFTSPIGFYGVYGCNVTISWRAKCTPADRLDEILDGRHGANDYKDFCAATLHKFRHEINVRANHHMDAAYMGGVYNGLTVACRPLSVSNWQKQTATWWGEAVPATAKPQTFWDTLAGFSCTIPFGAGQLMQYPESATG